jgi:glutamyl-tRNA reductase
MLDRLVVDALRAGRRVRATTALGRGSVSVLSVSVELALAMCPGEARRAFVLGRSRTASAARDRLLAAGWAVTHAPFLEAPSRRGSLLAAFDVIVTCTGTRGTVIPAQALENAAAHRDGAPVIVLDLSVPRDVDPRAAAVDGVLLHDVDTLALAAAPAVAARRAGIADAERIVDDELSRFETWCADRMLAPTIKALRSHVRDVVVHALGTVDSTTVEQLVNRMLHAPTRRLRAAAADGRAEHFTRLVRSLFGLDDELPGPGRAGGAGVTG